MEEMGMTDLQYKSFLKGLIEDLEEIEDLGVSDEAREKTDKLKERFKSDVES